VTGKAGEAGVRVKVCGLTREADVALACALGADFVGFVLWPGSPRAVTVEAARALAASVPPPVSRVGVFVDATVEEMVAAVTRIGLDAVQLHGDEPASVLTALPCRVIRATSLARAPEVLATLPAGALPLLDAIDARARGGTGRRIDWTAAASLARQRPLLLAGGLTPDNLAEAIATVQPWGVDVSSGVEVSPGCKDPARMRAFFDAARRRPGGLS
jgi:phosphoribosylanthranilate isomerase